MTYLELLQTLEHRLGAQHLPLNPRATTIKNLIDGSPVHHDMVCRLVQALYHANHCTDLKDNVHKDACFAAIGPVRRDVLKTPSTDVDAYHLLEDFCHALDEAFAAGHPEQVPDAPQSAEVISLDAARRRKSR